MELIPVQKGSKDKRFAVINTISVLLGEANTQGYDSVTFRDVYIFDDGVVRLYFSLGVTAKIAIVKIREIDDNGTREEVVYHGYHTRKPDSRSWVTDEYVYRPGDWTTYLNMIIESKTKPSTIKLISSGGILEPDRFALMDIEGITDDS